MTKYELSSLPQMEEAVQGGVMSKDAILYLRRLVNGTHRANVRMKVARYLGCGAITFL